MRRSWVGALSSWSHCPLESGGTLPLQGDAAQPLRLTPRMAGVATARPLLLENTWETSTEKRQKREEEGESTPQKDKPDASLGSWNVTPAAWKNRLGKGGLRGTPACWHSGLRAVAQVRVCSSQTRRALTSLGLVWPSGL